MKGTREERSDSFERYNDIVDIVLKESQVRHRLVHRMLTHYDFVHHCA